MREGGRGRGTVSSSDRLSMSQIQVQANRMLDEIELNLCHAVGMYVGMYVGM